MSVYHVRILAGLLRQIGAAKKTQLVSWCRSCRSEFSTIPGISLSRPCSFREGRRGQRLSPYPRSVLHPLLLRHFCTKSFAPEGDTRSNSADNDATRRPTVSRAPGLRRFICSSSMETAPKSPGDQTRRCQELPPSQTNLRWWSTLLLLRNECIHADKPRLLNRASISASLASDTEFCAGASVSRAVPPRPGI